MHSRLDSYTDNRRPRITSWHFVTLQQATKLAHSATVGIMAEVVKRKKNKTDRATGRTRTTSHCINASKEPLQFLPALHKSKPGALKQSVLSCEKLNFLQLLTEEMTTFTWTTII